ncbi:hypothetical protein BQ8769_173 [Escherichia coli]|uniref:Uncharacterized protein n=1 Tax=Escherichia coli TaxID=562 RepID=A0A1W1EMH0_ECOLX|nr:hypothetical protein BQ8769_173 [Escherichia coli]
MAFKLYIVFIFFLKKQKIPNIDKTESDSSGIANVLADVPDKTVQKQSVRRHVE